MSKLIHVATISSPHGLHGQFKLNCLLDSAQNLTNFKQFFTQDGSEIALKLISVKSKMPIASLTDVSDRNGAEALKSTKIFVKASDFPQTLADEFYGHELEGLIVLDADGKQIGHVLAHHNFGAGDILEIKFTSGNTEMFPFNDASFPELDMDAGHITFIPPEYI